MRYANKSIPHLKKILIKNKKVLSEVSRELIELVKRNQFLYVFGSGHSALFPQELFHRAGGAYFVIPVTADFLLPSSGPKKLRKRERREGAFNFLLKKLHPQKGEMIWLASNSGINGGIIELATLAKKMGLTTVAFTNLKHSRSVCSRHSQGKKLFEVCDKVIDLGGRRGDACVFLRHGLYAGPLSTLSLVFLGHTLMVEVCASLEKQGHASIYTSVNTPEGEIWNQKLEKKARQKFPV